MTFDPFMVYGPLTGAAGALALFGWRREMLRRFRRDVAKEMTRRKELLKGAAVMRPNWEFWSQGGGCGQIPLLVDGSYGSGVLPLILQEFSWAGAADYVGPILLLELDEKHREACLANIPPVFLDRVIAVQSEYSVGMSGLSVSKVLGLFPEWRSDVMAATNDWLGRIQRDSKPGLLLALISPGGSAALGYPPAKAFAERYPGMPIYAATILDEKTIVRERFPEVRALYSTDNLVRGFIGMDNRRFVRRSDLGLAVLFAAGAPATWISDSPQDLWNHLAYIFPDDAPGRFATLSTWGETLPVYHLPQWEKTLPEVFYTKGGLVEEKARRGIQAVVKDPARQSLPLPRADLGNARLCCVAGPLAPKSRADTPSAVGFRDIGQRVNEALEPWRVEHDIDITIQYASIGAPMDAQNREVPFIVVLLQPLKDDPAAVDALATGAPIRPEFLPPSFIPRNLQPAVQPLLNYVPREEPVRIGGEVA